MKAMILNRQCDLSVEKNPLQIADLPIPVPGDGEILVKVAACGICHTELDEIEGRTPPPSYPVILGHQVVGRVVKGGPNTGRFQPGARVGIAWIHWACGSCRHCGEGLENLCAGFKATGRDVNGGYAEYTLATEAFAFELPERFSDAQAAPLLCAGAIGYRSLFLTGIENGQTLGLTGFGASAHLVLKMAAHRFPGTKVYVFARSLQERVFAMELGAEWTGGTTDPPPVLLDAIIDTTPAWRPVVSALSFLAPGGRLVINAIRKESVDNRALLDLDYPAHLWMEKEIKSVANVTRRDVSEFLALSETIPIVPEVEVFPLTAANTALMELKERKIRGAKVLLMEG